MIGDPVMTGYPVRLVSSPTGPVHPYSRLINFHSMFSSHHRILFFCLVDGVLHLIKNSIMTYVILLYICGYNSYLTNFSC